MIIKKRDGSRIRYKPVSAEKLEELSQLAALCLSSQSYVLICMIGNKGVGKSTLGKFFRNKGFGRFSPRDIAVIDDDNMAVDFLFFFRRWHREPCNGIDELAPFLRFRRKKRVLFYIKSNPQSRITKADILLRLHLDEKTRKKRLFERYRDQRGATLYRQSLSYDPTPPISFRYVIDAAAN